jgi:hypothetical protein
LADLYSWKNWLRAALSLIGGNLKIMKFAILGAILLSVSTFPVLAQAQCSNSTLSGTYIYSVGGTVKNPTSTTATETYDEQGKLTFNGNGSVTGSTTSTIAGVLASLTINGTYSVNANCSGTVTLTSSAQSAAFSIQVYSGGSTALISATSSPLGELASGHLFRAANATGSQCGNGSVQGAFAMVLGGGTYVGTTRSDYANQCQVVFDGNGHLTAAGEITTAAAGGTAWTGTGTYTIAADCTGSAQITTANGTMNLILGKTSGGGLIIFENDLSTAVNGSADAQQLGDILTQLAFGDGWYTGMYFTNSNSTSVSFIVSFTADAGTALSIPGVGTSTVVTLAPQSTAIIEAQNIGTTLFQGYASASLPSGVSAYGVFRQSTPGTPNQEAVVSFKNSSSTAETLIFDNTTSSTTGVALTTSVAIANPGTTTANITIATWNAAGTALGTTTLQLNAGAKTEATLAGFTGLAATAGQKGLALFTTTSGNVSVLGLRFSSAAFTSIPTIQQQ